MILSMSKTNVTEYKTIKMIKTNPKYSNLLDPLSNLEYETLKNSIKEKVIVSIIRTKSVFKSF